MFTFPAVKNPIIAALDVPDAEQAIKLAEAIAPAVGAFKIGKELFVSAGPDVVHRIRDLGANIFLDLKFHDIPNTVAKAVASATRLDVQMLTVHTCGGTSMLKAAVKAAGDGPLVLGVTVLTGLDYAGDGEWSNGEIYSPDNGKTYSAKATLDGDDRLDVRGYIGISLIGRSQSWQRVSDDAPHLEKELLH